MDSERTALENRSFFKLNTSIKRGIRYFVPKVTFEDIKSVRLGPHLKLFPFDILVLIFIGQAMLPLWAAFLLVIVNVGTWWCYHRIPQFLRRVSGAQGEGILIPGNIVEYFARFIHSCGVHHRAHYGLMFTMMAGFHTVMSGQIWGMTIPMSYALIIAWSGYAALLVIDFRMYWVSVRTLQELRLDSLEEANRYTEDLKRSNVELENFAYIASHDLRSPLRGIINLSKWIEKDIGDTCSDDTRNNLRLLKSRTQRMDNLLNDLLQYSRIGRIETEVELIRPAQLAEEVFDTLAVQDHSTIHVSGHDLEFIDYRVPYEMILSNLITNAIKHNSKAHKNVWVSTQLVEGRVELQVEDDGPGVEEIYREKIFEVFTTLDRRDKKEASGMGLAIVNKIITHQGGSIRLDDSPHGGARFIVTLPLSQQVL